MESEQNLPDIMEIGTAGDFRLDWNERVRTLGANEVAAFGKKSHVILGEYFAFVVAQRICDILQLNDRDKVLDLGCGPARITKHIAGRVYTLHGVDVSDEMLKTAEKVVPKNVKLSLGNGTDLANFTDNQYDAVYCYAVFIHVSNDIQMNYIKESLRVLRPGGTALFHVRYGQKNFEHFNKTFSGESFSEELVDKVSNWSEVKSVELRNIIRSDDVCLDLNTRRWLIIKKS